MRTQKTLGILSAVLFLSFAAIVLPGDASAQGRYVERYSKSDVSAIIRRLEDSSDRFRGDFDTAMDRSSLNGTNTEDRYNGYVKNYENSVDDLRDQFDRRDSWWESRSHVQTVISRAQPVNTMMNSLPFRRNLESQWNRMRGDLNTLADTYDLPGLGGGGWQGGPWNPGGPGGPGWGGGGGSRPPGWAIGTWYWTNGPDRRVTISSNGQIIVYSGGMSYNGWYNNGVMTINNQQSTITRMGNNIRTYNRATGETSDYSKNSWGGGDGPGWGGDRPPNWVVGSWQWTRGNRRLVINNNGRITVYTGGQTYSGNYNNGVLVIAGESSTISRNGSRLRTYNQSTGEVSDYRRQ